MFDRIEALAELTAGLDAVRLVSAKLLKHDPDDAAADLVTVLQEVAKTFNGFEAVLVRFLSLRFHPSTRHEDEQALIQLEGPQLRTMVGEFRAHCSRIGVIYDTTLRSWFAAAPITSQERQNLEFLFRELEDSDANTIIPAVEELADWLEKEVEATSQLVNDGRFEDAAEQVLAARRKVAPLRRRMGRIVGEFRDLEIQFTD